MKYGNCECGGKIIETIITYSRFHNGKFVIFENVPVGKCLECGEKVFKGKVLEKIEQLSKKTDKLKKVQVPVAVYE